jgi:hypothetical protein
MNTEDLKHDNYGDDSVESIMNISIVDLSKKKSFQGDDWSEDEKVKVDVTYTTPKPLDPMDKLKFAKRILIWIGIIFILTGIANIAIASDVVGQVWNFVSAVANSLIAVIIGYYFGKDK